MITSLSGETGLKIGQRIAIIPTHVCTTVNLHNYVWIFEGDTVKKVKVDARGMLQ
jgi:D-serine deaminase-like pyridoxal phosphate-dependent protein